MRQVIGWILVFSPVIALFAAIAIDIGLMALLVTLAGMVVCLGVIGLGAWLVAPGGSRQ